jgi:hypothetical protein
VHRSIAIDEVRKRLLSKDTRVLHVYFDYKSQHSQTAPDIARQLLRQLLAHQGDISTELETLYNKNALPDLSACKSLLTTCARKFRTLYTVFDAFDECSEENQKEVLNLFRDLSEFDVFRIMISSRPHLLPNLRDSVTDLSIITVTANVRDLKNYISRRLDTVGNRDKNLKSKCLELADHVNGMFDPRGEFSNSRFLLQSYG